MEIKTFLIKSNHGEFEILIDKEDFDKVSKHTWSISKTKNYIRVETRINYKLVRLHRFVLNINNKSQIDHINRNTLDNRKFNLRICNKSTNGMNRSRQINNKSGFKGVSYHKKGKKWAAQIVSNGQCHYLGLFTTKELAAVAYNEAAIKLHGEFAYLNKIVDINA